MTRYRPALIHMVLPVLWIMSCISCTPSDEKRLLGKWQCERDWFLFKDSQTYDSGKDDIQMVTGFTYTIDSKLKELNLYTHDPHTTYYLIYQFKGSDTLEVRNALSSRKTMILFHRVHVTNGPHS